MLTTTTVVSMVSPVPLGMWAERYGERHVYVGLTVTASVAALLLTLTLTLTLTLALTLR